MKRESNKNKERDRNKHKNSILFHRGILFHRERAREKKEHMTGGAIAKRSNSYSVINLIDVKFWTYKVC